MFSNPTLKNTSDYNGFTQSIAFKTHLSFAWIAFISFIPRFQLVSDRGFIEALV